MQSKLLRAIQQQEIRPVGANAPRKVSCRVIAATNRDLEAMMGAGEFREDLYYRLNTVPIRVPALRERREDIILLFRKFAVDFAEKYKASPIQLDEQARQLLIDYPWPGNVRELKNMAEQISVLSQDKLLSADDIRRFLPEHRENRLPAISPRSNTAQGGQEFMNERDILYKLFFDMKKDVTELKKMFVEIVQHPPTHGSVMPADNLMHELDHEPSMQRESALVKPVLQPTSSPVLLQQNMIQDHVEVEESLNLMDMEKDLIEKALRKHKSKRKDAASDLGISERTLYRKLKEYNIDE
jgi:DNA-binding NtrC family response regulator